jgi:hypothetical protein
MVVEGTKFLLVVVLTLSESRGAGFDHLVMTLPVRHGKSPLFIGKPW